MTRAFADDVRAVLETLEPGQLITYGEVAAEAGRPGAARAVGTLLKDLPGVPWWRVVNAAGRVCPTAVAEATQRLRAEGVAVANGRVRRPRPTAPPADHPTDHPTAAPTDRPRLNRGAPIRIDGAPYGPQRAARGRAWRSMVADAAAGQPPATALRLEFELRPGRWVDLDTLAETAVAGLRDAGMYPRALAGLDAVLAVKRFGPQPGLRVWPTTPAGIARRWPPGPVLLDVTHDEAVHAGATDAKRRWRSTIAAGWTRTHPLDGPVWADLEIRRSGSLLGSLEPVLDALEPCLGRDPRGQPRQEFFPNDDLITWLRVRRGGDDGHPLVLRLGPVSP